MVPVFEIAAYISYVAIPVHVHAPLARAREVLRPFAVLPPSSEIDQIIFGNGKMML